MSLKGQNILITGATGDIGSALAHSIVRRAGNVICLGRNEKKLHALALSLDDAATDRSVKIACTACDVGVYSAVADAVRIGVEDVGEPDVLINNAGLALGAPRAFHELKIDEVDEMVGTNVSGFLYAAHAVLNEGGMAKRKRGMILNVTSTTGLEVPPFPGEAVYHTSKAAQEAFTNVLRTELQDTNIKVVALRPGVVATHFHQQRVGYDDKQYQDFMSGYEPLVAEDVAEAAMVMLEQKERVNVKALDVVPTAQRSLQVFDRNWKKRNGISE